jgi:ABC-type Fe3+ transport system permease subunit
VIPDIVGGPNSEMIGNKIAQRTFVDRNLPHASGLAALLTVAVLPMLVITPCAQAPPARRRGRGARMKRSRLPPSSPRAVLLFFYLPIVVLVVNSFNASRFGGTWEGSR